MACDVTTKGGKWVAVPLLLNGGWLATAEANASCVCLVTFEEITEQTVDPSLGFSSLIRWLAVTATGAAHVCKGFFEVMVEQTLALGLGRGLG